MAHSIVVDVLAKTGSFETDMARAAKYAKKASNDIEKSFANLGRSIKGGFAAVVGGLTFGAIVDMTRASIDAIDALNDLSDATGASIENLSALEDVALRSGTSMETAGDAVVKLNKALADAKPDSDQAKAFAKLNLNIAELKKLDPVEALRRTAIALDGFANDANKSRLTQELFGKSLKEVAPLLKDVAEKGELNAKVTTEQAEAAETFNKNVAGLVKDLQDLGRETLINPIVALFNALFEGMRKVNTERERGKTLGWENFLPGFAGMQMDVDALTGATGAGNSAFGAFSNVVTRPPKPSVGEISAKTKKAAAAGKFEFADAIEDMLDRIKAGDELKLSKLLDTMEEMRKFVEGGGTLPDSIWAGLAEDLAKVDPAARDAKKALDLLAGTPSANLAAMVTKIGEINRLLASGSLTVEQWAEAIRSATGTASDGIDEVTFSLEAMLAATPGGKMDAMLKKIEFINAQYEGGAVSVEQWAELIRDATGTTADAADETDRLADAAKDLGMTFSSAFEDAILEGAKMSDMLKALEKDIARILWRKLVTEPMANAITGWATQIGSAVGAAWGNSTAPTTTGGSGSITVPATFDISARAGGGPVSAGSSYLVGERGPELFAPSTSGYIVPNGQRSGSQVQVINNLGVQAQPTVEQRPDGMMRIVLNSVAEDTRRGGVTARATAGRFGVNNGATLNRRRG